ncbi:HAE1 family hydrophobic/amphiphilic exporter-1 [Hypnocyclicus thermotrophus]|uniref:HAE1 family hydrophobic/amphiphilic exporter-1 n=1 Tax=Hypnocyclicus thermotrophus TaxID=1627895 RepID=A0AA46DYG2_9FUSO|nr:efflux RND transporter permease subunit [Hypnocyclicus thermotrophus]TDT69888.1 HAE1 family hydrophobic/amphiphilic exporter-1 [Hypnocyclicus thermotrophus]
MKSISHFAIKKSVTTIMLIITMVGAGVLGMLGMSSQLLPDFDIPVSIINITWIGASPEDIDKLITSEVEDALTGIDGIKNINGYSSQNISTVVVQFNYGTDTDEKIREIQTKVNNIKKDLPSDIGEPFIDKFDINAQPILIYNLFGSDLVELNSLAENIIKPRLEKISGVGEIRIKGGLKEEILVELEPEKLAAYSLDIMQIKSILSSSNINIPLGNLKEGDKEFIVKVIGEIKTIEQVKNIVVSNNGGQLVKLSDVANIKLSTEDVESFARQNGEPSIRIEVIKVKEGNTVNIAEEAKKVMENLKESLPPGINTVLATDFSIPIKQSIGTVSNNAIVGIILASIILLIFLKNIRATLVVAIAIPVSVVFTFALLPLKNITLNVISLMGLALGVGMLVDNSIVVIDNIYRHLTELKEDKFTASANGASEMSVPIIASTATTVAVFLPIVMREGMAKEIFHDMSFSITFALISSLVVALTFVPMAASKFLDPKKSITKEGKILVNLKRVYVKILDRALKHKIITVLIAFLMFIGSIGLATLTIKTEFFPQMDQSEYLVKAKLSKGLDVKKADLIAKSMEKIVKADKFTVNYSTAVSKENITINIKTLEKNERKETINDIISQIRPKLANIPDAKITVSASSGGPGGGSDGGVQLKIYSDDLDKLSVFSQIVLEKVKKIPGLVDVKSSYEGGNPELKLDIDRDKAQYYGLRVSDIAFLISYQVQGTDAFTIKTSNKDVDVKVRIAEDYRNSIEKILDLELNTRFGKIKIKDIASFKLEEGAAQIEKENKSKIITISANTDNIDLRTATAKIKEVIKELDIPAGIRYDFGGDQEQFVDVMKDLLFGFGIAIFLMYFILASQFESFTMPIIIMGSLPLSIIGVLIGLAITRVKFNIMVMVGIIMLAGIVVNNAIVLIDYINVLRARNHPLIEAIKIAGRTRLRPIIMTTATTIFGMLPLALGIGQGTEFYQGMAIAVIFGLLFATLLTLILIPVLYSIEESIRIKFKNKHKLKYETSIYKN